MKCKITSRDLYSWEYGDCNDCDDKGTIEITYPKFKPIKVCRKCYKEYYEEQVSVNFGYRNIKRIY